MKILFVCTGNTCRSPMAEGIFRRMLEDEKIENIECASAGLSAITGDEVSANSVKAVQKYGVDISNHRASAINSYKILDTDLFVCMTKSHRFAIASAIGDEKVIVLNSEISDPYGGDLETYEKCADEICEGLKLLLQDLKDQVIITPMTESHIKEIAQIENECFSTPWSEKSLSEEIDNQNAHFVSAVYKNKVVGYMGVHSVAGECYVDNIAVTKDMREKGIATKLVDRAFREAILRGDEFISLEVRKSNVKAISLYSKFGFEIRGERKDFYTSPKEDAHIMTLMLKEQK